MRRGIGLLLMSALLPGSAQLAVGSRRVGLVALRVWAVLVALAVLLVLVGLVSRSTLVTVLGNPLVAAMVVVAMVGGALGWSALLVDAWRLAHPPAMGRANRRRFAAATVALVVLVCSAYGIGARATVSSARTLDAVFAGGGTVAAADGRVNVLLLGADAGQNRQGLRPDSLTLASVDVRTGRTVLFSLPRNLEDVPFPVDSPMHELYPDGFGCDDHECMLNAVYTAATEAAAADPDLYPGVDDPGAQATKEAVEEFTGLSVNYYAMVDMAGFSALVDALGGIELDIARDVPIGGGSSPILGWIPAGEGVRLDGYEALWFARSREGSSDFERMQRQKCVMTAVLHQTDPVTVVARFDELARAGQQLVVTDIPRSDLGRLTDLALKARDLPISNISFVPPLVYPGNPQYDVLRATVGEHVEAAEDADRAARRTEQPADAMPTDAPGPGEEPATEPLAARTPVPASQDAIAAANPEPAPVAEADLQPTASPSTSPGTADLDAICRVASTR